jgi:hypothetical protein
MITLKFEINTEVSFQDEEHAKKLVARFIEAAKADPQHRISWEMLNDIMYFDAQQYYAESVALPDMDLVTGDIAISIKIRS